MRIPQANAKGVLLWWGKFRFMYSYAALYIGAIQLLLVAVIAYNTTLRPWIAEYLGWDITLWQYGLILITLLIIGMALEFTFGIPGLIAVSNEQTYKHANPIKADFTEVKNKQAEIDEKLNKIMKRLNIE